MIKVKVVGAGCSNCQKLDEMCREVIAENNIEAEIEKILEYKTHFAGNARSKYTML